MVDLLSYFSFQPVLHDRCNKELSCLWDAAYKIVAAAGFLSRCLNGRLPHARRHKTVNVLSASLSKTFPSFLPFLYVWNRCHRTTATVVDIAVTRELTHCCWVGICIIQLFLALSFDLCPH